MTETANLHLKKPENSDLVNVSDFNSNSDILDTAVHQIQMEIETARGIYDSLNARLIAIEQLIIGLDDRVTALENPE